MTDDTPLWQQRLDRMSHDLRDEGHFDADAQPDYQADTVILALMRHVSDYGSPFVAEPTEETIRQQTADWLQNATDYRSHAAAMAVDITLRVFEDVRWDRVHEAWRDDFFKLVKDTPSLDWLLLTKRPQNAPEARRRIPRLFAIPAVRYFARMEPLLGPVILCALRLAAPPPGLGLPDGPCTYDALSGAWRSGEEFHETRPNLPRLDWVITGGESGPKARPTHPDWVRALRDTCREAGVAFFHKQWGAWRPATEDPADNDAFDVPPNWRDDPNCVCLDLAGVPRSGFRGGGEVFLKRMSKKAAGRDLDGRTWDQVPGYRH